MFEIKTIRAVHAHTIRILDSSCVSGPLIHPSFVRWFGRKPLDTTYRTCFAQLGIGSVHLYGGSRCARCLLRILFLIIQMLNDHFILDFRSLLFYFVMRLEAISRTIYFHFLLRLLRTNHFIVCIENLSSECERCLYGVSLEFDRLGFPILFCICKNSILITYWPLLFCSLLRYCGVNPWFIIHSLHTYIT